LFQIDKINKQFTEIGFVLHKKRRRYKSKKLSHKKLSLKRSGSFYLVTKSSSYKITYNLPTILQKVRGAR